MQYIHLMLIFTLAACTSVESDTAPIALGSSAVIFPDRLTTPIAEAAGGNTANIMETLAQRERCASAKKNAYRQNNWLIVSNR